MSLPILQVNTRCWKNNRYLLQCELCNHQPDIILINETGEISNIKLQGYTSKSSALGVFLGVCIMIRSGLSFCPVPLMNPNILAIKLITTLGTIIIATAYIACRGPLIPTKEIYKLSSHNLPTVIMDDFNAHHPMFGNSPINRLQGDPKGKTLTSLAIKKNMKFIGPHFKTFITRCNKGKPDIALTNHHFNLFHYHMYPGNSVGSDHIPVILKVSMQPIRILSQPKKSIKTLNITAYKEQLNKSHFPNLNKMPIHSIDVVAENIIENTQQATDDNYKTSHTVLNPLRLTNQLP